ncbi:lipid A biosynthesis lauroyl acyltransferase [Longispora fulva]|uniref:KDO2-lipid IV(A) lauroyltransferase n=1 Tax=Longispora fulva TaxID=619741 RepID=A0A8J7KNM8_9ACTN|nr:phosphatidylinositol mannoside acyltransferase [Longispora fulva]MBG6141769.1 KDO2-lipid IV(A) lauroyltransferase [Longispora fulva]GIG59075.1 lipid A biosynthesis lauroyl acyltransferase [Longispora fulva]
MTLQEWGYTAGWRIVRALPGPVATGVFRAGADRAARRRGPGVQRLEANLRRVAAPDADIDALVRAGMRSYARYWMEAFRLPSRSRAQILDGFRLEGGETLIQHGKAGEGAVVALPHGGNWDAAGAWAAASGIPLTTVAERLKPEALYQRFLDFRESLGMSIIPERGGDRPPIDVLVERVQAGHLVPLLADRDLSRRGVEVTFFGGRTRMPAGPALLALRTGAPLYTVSMWYEPDAACGRLVGPLPVPASGTLAERVAALTQSVADSLALGIAEHPEDWHMLQKLWLDPS